MADRFVKVTHSFIEAEMRKITPAAMCVYLVLLKHRNVKTGACFPSEALISQQTGLSESTVRRALRNLQRNELVTVEKEQRGPNRGGWRNTYKIK